MGLRVLISAREREQEQEREQDISYYPLYVRSYKAPDGLFVDRLAKKCRFRFGYELVLYISHDL